MGTSWNGKARVGYRVVASLMLMVAAAMALKGWAVVTAPPQAVAPDLTTGPAQVTTPWPWMSGALACVLLACSILYIGPRRDNGASTPRE